MTASQATEPTTKPAATPSAEWRVGKKMLKSILPAFVISMGGTGAAMHLMHMKEEGLVFVFLAMLFFQMLIFSFFDTVKLLDEEERKMEEERNDAQGVAQARAFALLSARRQIDEVSLRALAIRYFLFATRNYQSGQEDPSVGSPDFYLVIFDMSTKVGKIGMVTVPQTMYASIDLQFGNLRLYMSRPGIRFEFITRLTTNSRGYTTSSPLAHKAFNFGDQVVVVCDSVDKAYAHIVKADVPELKYLEALQASAIPTDTLVT